MTYRAWNLKTLDRAAVRELTHAIAEQNTEELEYHSQSEEPWTEAQYNATLAAQQKETALLAGILILLSFYLTGSWHAQQKAFHGSH